MLNNKSFGFCIIALLGLCGCQTKEKTYVEKPLSELYNTAFKELEDKNFKKAAENFDDVEQQYPYTYWATQAQLMSAYASYRNKNYTRAIGMLDNFMALHPSHSSIPYAYYLRAICYRDQITGIDKDADVIKKAYHAFATVVERFPGTPYAQDAATQQKVLFNDLAAHALVVGRFYLKKNNTLAALKRFQEVITTYPTSAYVPEALYRLVACSVALGLFQEARAVNKRLQHDFKDSSWAKEGQDILERYTKTKA